jgi:hypothetical protein
MTRRTSIIAYSLVIVLVLLGLQSWSIALGRAEQRVLAAIEQRTGLVVTKRERAEFALLPLPRISLSNVEFHQRDGLLKGSALRVRARVRLLALLSGSLGFDRVDLVVPQIDVAVAGSDDGIATWLAAPMTYLERLTVQSRIVVTGGSVFMRADGAIRTILRDVNLVIDSREAREPLTLSGSMIWRGVPTEVSLLWPMAGEQGRLTLNASSALMTLGFEGTRSGLTEPVVNGKLALATKTLPDLLGWFGERPRLADAVGALSLAADAQIKPGEASLSNAIASLDGDRLVGAIKLADAGGRLALSGTLAGAGLDLGRLYGRLDLHPPEQEPDQSPPLDFLAWTAQDVDLRVSVEAARFNGARLDDVATYLLVKKGRFEAGLLRAAAYGGSARGRLLALAAPGGVDVKLQATLDRISLARAAADLPGLAKLSGAGGAQITLDGVGHSAAQILGSLSGKASLTLRQGEIGGFAFADLLRRAERNPRVLLRDWRQGKTAFDQAMVNLAVADGLATVTEAQMTGAAYRLAAAGSISLPQRWIDMTAQLSPANGQTQLPFILRGPLGEPRFELDAPALLRSGGAAIVPTVTTR